MAQDKKKLGDYMEILLPAFDNQVATIFRVETSEEQWARAKAAAQESGTLRTLKESGKAATSSGTENPKKSDDELELRDPMTGVVARLPRGDIPERRWKALKSQVEKGDTTLDWQQQKEYGSAPAVEKPTANVPTEGPGVIDQVRSAITAGAPQPAQPDQSGGGGSLAKKFFGNAVMGSLPGGVPDAGGAPQPSPVQPSDAGVPMTDGGVQPPISMPAPSPIGVSGGAAPDAGVPAAPTGLTSPPPDASSGQMPDMGHQATVLTNPTDLAVAKGLPQASGTPPMSGGAPPPPAPGPQASFDPSLGQQQKVGMQQKTTTPGSGMGGGLESDLNRAYGDMARAKLELSRQEALKSAEVATLEVKKAKSLEIAEQARAAKAQAALDEQNKLIAAQMKVAESLSEQLKVDPKRLWASRSAEQKSNAQLAGFLFGLSGTGADYVRSLQNEVQKDVETQIQQFEANRASKTSQFNALGSVFAQYRQMGFDAATAAEAAKASINDIHSTKLNEIAARYQGTTAGARAAEAVAALGAERVAGLNKLRDSAAQRASLAATTKLNALELEAKIAAKEAAKGAGAAVPAVLKKEMAELEDGIANIDQMMRDAGGGFFSRAAVDMASMPGGGVLAPEKRAVGRDYAGRAFTMMTNLARGALQPAEMAELSKIIPKEIKASEDPEPYLRMARDYLVNALQRRKQSYGTGPAGPDTRGPSAASNYGFNAE